MHTQCISLMRDKILNMDDLAINIIPYKLKVKCFGNPHYAYTEPLFVTK